MIRNREELLDLPDGAVVVYQSMFNGKSFHIVWEKDSYDDSDAVWYRPGSDVEDTVHEVMLPVRVVWQPGWAE